MNNAPRRGAPQRLCSRAGALAPLLVAGAILFFANACQAAPTPTPVTAAPPHRVEGGVAAVRFEQQTLVLDARAAPHSTIKLDAQTEIVNADQKPISLLDLRDGDFVRVEGRATETEFLAARITRVRVAARVIPTPTPSVTPVVTPTPSRTPPIMALDRLALPGTLLIGDAGNNRVIEINNDKRIVWEFPPPNANHPNWQFAAPDSAFFTPDGKSVLANLGRQHTLAEIDYATRKIVWTFGEWGIVGADAQHLSAPKDAYRLADGRTVVADVGNCRIAFIAADKRIGEQIGKPGECKNDRGAAFRPNGVTLLPNGRLLITETGSRRVSEIAGQGKVARSVTIPDMPFLSDAQVTRAGNVLVAIYDKPGRVIEVTWDGQIIWEYFPRLENERLDRPSRAFELPNGNIAIGDDYNHRVIIINRAGKIVWQYGVTGVAGKAAGYLHTPAGIDFRAIPITAATLTAIAPTPTRTRPTSATPRPMATP